MPKLRHKWRYDMEILIFSQKQNMHEKEPREGHVMVTSIWSRDQNLFSSNFRVKKFRDKFVAPSARALAFCRRPQAV